MRYGLLVVASVVAASALFGGCASRSALKPIAERSPTCDVPMRPLPQMTSAPKVPDTPFGWGFALKRYCLDWYAASDRSRAHAMPWPTGFNPQRNAVFAHNEIFIPGVPPSRVFDVLIDAARWPSFYPNSDAVSIGPVDRLASGAQFTWRTFATRQRSRVLLFEPDRALGWSADSPGTHAFHRWILESQQGGTLVITEEVQHGWLASIDRAIMNPALSAAHQLWLTRLQQYVQAQ